MDKYPLQIGNNFAWQSAYADAFDTHYMLNGKIWDMLRHNFYEDNYLYKYYGSYESAMKDYEYAKNNQKD